MSGIADKARQTMVPDTWGYTDARMVPLEDALALEAQVAALERERDEARTLAVELEHENRDVLRLRQQAEQQSATIARLTSETDSLRQQVHQLQSEHQADFELIDAQGKVLDRLTAALRQYADPTNWQLVHREDYEDETGNNRWCGDSPDNGWSLARAALEAGEEGR